MSVLGKYGNFVEGSYEPGSTPLDSGLVGTVVPFFIAIVEYHSKDSFLENHCGTHKEFPPWHMGVSQKRAPR